MYRSSRPADLAKTLHRPFHLHAQSPIRAGLACHWHRRTTPGLCGRHKHQKSKASQTPAETGTSSDHSTTLKNPNRDAEEEDHAFYNTFREEISTQHPYSREWAARILPLFEVDPPPDAQIPSTPEDLERDLLVPFQRRHRQPGERQYSEFDQKSIFPIELRRAMAMSSRKSDPSKPRPRGPPPRRERPNDLLEHELRIRAHEDPHPQATVEILTVLVEERLVKPTEGHYEALILSCCRAETSSVKDVRFILEEMRREGFQLSPAVWAAVLKALTVHPDGFLREEAFSALQQQAVDIPTNLGQLAAVALIREQQLELAWLEIQNLTIGGTQVETWVWVLLIHALCEVNDLDAVLQIFYILRDSSQHIPRPTLRAVLHRAAVARHLDLTRLIWHTYVEPMHIQPDLEVCIEAMSTADLHNDLNLGESAFLIVKCTAEMLMHPTRGSEASDADSRVETSTTSPSGSANGDDSNVSSPTRVGQKGTPSPEALAPLNTVPDHDAALQALATAETTLGRIRSRHGTTTLTHEQETRNRRGNLYAMFRLPEHEHAMFDPIVGLTNPWAWWLPYSRVTGRLRRLDGKPKKSDGRHGAAADGEQELDPDSTSSSS